jgi:nucleoside-diphosphate-sugar epimerase
MSKVNILLTGSTGFLGSYIKKTFDKAGCEVTTLGRNKKNIIQVDLSKKNVLFHNELFEMIIHCEGKAHFVPKTQIEKTEFYNVNVNGTKNLLRSLETLKTIPRYFVFISSVSVYGLISGKLITEEFPLNATDSYGNSKIIAENLVQEWCKQHDVIYTILRLPLVIGVNSNGNLEKMIDGLKKGYYFNIDGGLARKSMVLAEDVANFIPKVASMGGIYNLTDGQHPNFFNLSKLIADRLGKRHPYNIPKYFAFILSKIGDLIGNTFPINSDKFSKITADLTFDDSKARTFANWNSTPVLDGFTLL